MKIESFPKWGTRRAIKPNKYAPVLNHRPINISARFGVNSNALRFAHTPNNVRCYTTRPADKRPIARNAIHWDGHIASDPSLPLLFVTEINNQINS